MHDHISIIRLVLKFHLNNVTIPPVILILIILLLTIIIIIIMIIIIMIITIIIIITIIYQPQCRHTLIKLSAEMKGSIQGQCTIPSTLTSMHPHTPAAHTTLAQRLSFPGLLFSSRADDSL